MEEYKTRAVNTAFLTHVAGVTEIHEGALWCLCLHALAAERERPLLKSEKVRIGSWKGGDGISHVCHQRNWFASCFALSLSFVIIHSLHLSPNPPPPPKKAKNKNKKQTYLYPECLWCLPSVQIFSFTNIRMHEFEKKPDRELMTLWWTGFPASLPVCCISVYEIIRGAQQQSPGLESLLYLVCMFFLSLHGTLQNFKLAPTYMYVRSMVIVNRL